jgi:signal transduction histidine kinase/ligand-binding sensor domain-containing protein/DNA-binding response OmpR family regulator
MASKVHIVHLLIVFSFLFISKLSFPQNEEIQFEHINVEQGLSQNTIYCIFQDSRGFIWFGSQDGLNRYDGYGFTIFKHNPDDPTSLSANVIWCIYEDGFGVLWIGTLGGGINKFDREKEQFIDYRHNPDDSTSLSNNTVLSIYEDNSSELWIGTEGGGLNKLVRGESKKSPPTFVHYKHDPNEPNSLSHNVAYSICEDKSGVLWIGTLGGGLNELISGDNERSHPTFKHYKHDPVNPSSISDNLIYSVYEDNFGELWIGTVNGGLNKLIRSDNKKSPPTFIRYTHDPNNPTSLSNNRVESIYEDNSGILWVGTQRGLSKLSRSDNEESPVNFIHYTHDPNNPTSLSDNRVQSIYEDKSGVLWIGTEGGGLNKFNLKNKQFNYYTNEPDNPASLSNNIVLSIYEDKSGVLWIGTYGGGLNKLIRGDTEESPPTFIQYKHDPNDPTSLGSNIVLSIYEDKSGVLWIGTYDGGLNKLIRSDSEESPSTFIQYKRDRNDPTSLRSTTVFSICEDKSGDLWIGTMGGGLNKLIKGDTEESSPTFIHYKNDPNDPTSFPDDSTNLNDHTVFSIYEDNSGVLWIGTRSGGLNKLVRGDSKESPPTFIHYTYDPNDPTSISANSIYSIYEDNSGELWIGTVGGGLNKFNRQKEQFKRYREIDGLPNNVIYGILEDDYGNLWVSTNKGLSKYNPKTKIFKNYDMKDGLRSNEFDQGAYYKSKSGEMFFGGINGIDFFHPDSIKGNPNIPPIVFTDFQLNNKPVFFGFDTTLNRAILNKSITETNEIELIHNDKVISFEFAALDFHSPAKNKYAYMLEGFEEDWKFTDASRRYVTYTNLDPGEYTFIVKGSNNNGIWNEEGATLKLIILPPWWQTIWAFILYAVIVLTVVYYTWKLQLKRVRIKHEYEMSRFETQKLHEMDQMKSRFFTNVSHEFRTPLTLILGPANDLINKEEDKSKKEELKIIRKSADRLHGLVNQLLDLSKLEADRMKLETCAENIIPLLKGLVLSFASLADRKKITLKFNSVAMELVVYIDRDKIEKIINNIISNSFKYTSEGGKIDVNVSKDEKNLEIKISDTGMGISKERIDKVFDRFYQVDGSHTKEQEGTGIGLALTKELVELHKGEIKVESKEGEGTTLTVLLPLGKEHLKPEEIVEKEIQEETTKTMEETEFIPETEKSKEKADIDVLLDTDLSADKAGKPLLLIVEDNSDVGNYIIGHLEDDYRIQEAIDGEDGFNKSIEQIPDLIVSDVMMPKMDGFELCNKLKTDERTSHIPVILLTAKTTSKDKIEGYETGADDYIMKPFDANELIVRVKNLIEQRKRIKEHFIKEGLFEISVEQIGPTDKNFLKKIVEIINKHISDTSFNIDAFADEVSMSRMQLHRKLVALVGEPPGSLIRRVRLSKAAKLIVDNFGNISEIALEVGFSNPANFAHSFRQQFGVSPSDYGRNIK